MRILRDTRRRHLTKDEKQAIHERDGHACWLCGATDNLNIHHIRPREVDGDHRTGNLIILCVPCHKAVHRKHPFKMCRLNRSDTRHKMKLAKPVMTYLAARVFTREYELSKIGFLMLLVVAFLSHHQEISSVPEVIADTWQIPLEQVRLGIAECVSKGYVYELIYGGYFIDFAAVTRLSSWRQVLERLDLPDHHTTDLYRVMFA